MKRKFLLLAALALVVVIALAACGGNDDDNNNDAGVETPAPTPAAPVEPPEELVAVDEEEAVLIHPALLPLMELYPAYTTNDRPILQRGDAGNILQVGTGVADGGGILGLFLGSHVNEANDQSINALAGTYSIVSVDASNMLSQNGIATFEIDRGANAVVLHMQHNVYWHDGVPLTLDDLVFAYEVISHPDYHGPRFDGATFIPNVVGIEEWRSGENDHISGMVLSNNNRSLRIYYVDPLPPGTLFAGGIWLQPIPRHWLTPAIEEVGFGEELNDHPRARDEILGFGPFIIESIVPGESVFMVANDNYWQGAPLVDGINVSIVPMSMIATATIAGDFDVIAFPAAQLPEFELANPSNFQLYGWPAASSTIFNFTMGYRFSEPTGEYDEDGEPIYTPPTVRLRTDDAPIMNPAIRRAIAHSVDRPLMAETIGNGLWVPATSILHPFDAGPFIDVTRQGFPFDLALASQILDDAGFTERDDEGFRLDLNGEPMTLLYAQHSNLLHDALVPVNIQNWASIGLRVELYTDDHMPWGLFLDTMVWTPNNEIAPADIFAMGWSHGMNPEPHGLWSPDAIFNMSRYTSPTFDQILYDIRSDNAWDAEFLASAYARFEQAFYEELPAFPFTWNLDLLALNNRVANVSRMRLDNGLNVPGNWSTTTFGDHLVALTAPAPYAN